MICKNIHQIWIGDKLPDKYKVWIDTIKQHHPEWNYKLWNEHEILRLIQDKYQWFYDTYVSYPYVIQRCDRARYLILLECGGIYCDLDVEFIKNIDSIVVGQQCVLFEENHINNDPDIKGDYTPWSNFMGNYLIGNAIMYSQPGSKFMYTCVKNLVRYAKKKWSDNYMKVMMTASPGFLTTIYNQYNSVCDVKVMQHETFESMTPYERKSDITPQSHDNVYGHHWGEFEWKCQVT